MTLDARITSLISCLGIHMSGQQNQDLSDVGNELEAITKQRDELAEAIRQFRNEPALGRMHKLRATAGYSALCSAFESADQRN